MVRSWRPISAVVVAVVVVVVVVGVEWRKFARA